MNYLFSSETPTCSFFRLSPETLRIFIIDVNYDESTGQKLPKICCPSAALSVNQKPPVTESPPPAPATDIPENKYSNHPARQLLADDTSCGISNPIGRIVGGQDALMGQYPWLVNLGYQQQGKPGTLFKCGGTLIGSRYVLTAD